MKHPTAKEGSCQRFQRGDDDAFSRWLGAVGVGVLLWIGLSAVQWVGSIFREKVPVKMAAIHAGDWLVKLVLIAGIVGVWR